MSDSFIPDSTPSAILRLVVPLLNSDTLAALGKLWRLGRHLVSSNAQEGMYEVLSHEVTLELQDTKGEWARYSKRQRVRFLQDNIIAYQDQAWGDGDIFVDYKCSPGIAVDRYREGYRYRILISLRETKNRGDIEEFQIERRIHNGFLAYTQDFLTHIDHTTHRFTMRIVFPHGRVPHQVTLVEQNTTRATVLGTEGWQTLPDGRCQVVWQTAHPRLFEVYMLHWVW